MSKKKIPYKNFRSCIIKIQPLLKSEIIIPVDMDEFSKMCFGRRNNVVVVDGSDHLISSSNLLPFFSAIQMVYGNKIVLLPYDADFSNTIDYFSKAICLPRDKDIIRTRCVRDWSWLTCDDDKFDEYVPNPCTTLKDVEDALSRNKMDKIGNPRVTAAFIITKDNVDEYRALKSRMAELKDDVYFIDYTPEKMFIDQWFSRNKTSLDPEFDMELFSHIKEWDMKSLFTYMATNHRYQFREYAKFNPELMAKFMQPQRIKELM